MLRSAFLLLLDVVFLASVVVVGATFERMLQISLDFDHQNCLAVRPPEVGLPETADLAPIASSAIAESRPSLREEVARDHEK